MIGTISLNMRKPLLIGLGLCSLLLSCSKDDDPATKEDPAIENPAEPMFSAQLHPIGIENRGGSAVFVDDRSGAIFNPRGTNYFNIVSTAGGFQDRFFHPNQFSRAVIRAVLQKLKMNGYNTVRIFLDTCSDDPNCIGNIDGPGLNKSYVQNIATLMDMAKEEDFFLILTSNDLPSQGGYWELSNQGSNDLIDGYRNSHYLTSQGVESAVKYWDDLMQALYREEAEFSHVLAWSILNEQWYFGSTPPFNLNTGSVSTANGKTYSLSSAVAKRNMAEESVLYYIEKVSEVIKSYDSDGLVTMGVFAPNHPHLWRQGDFKYVETSEIVNNSLLDFLDLHAYPATSTLSKLMENFNVRDPDAKPILMGEVGAFVADFAEVTSAGQALQKWMAQSCSFGFDGWLTWGWERAPLAIGDATWSFLDQEEHLMLELSPNKYPDACNETWLGAENLALGKKVTASNFIVDEVPEFAVDGDITTQWGAGSGPTQWLEIDLGGAFDITHISMVVSQFPEGNTTHTIWIRGDSGGYTELITHSGVTEDNDRLEWSGEAAGIRFVKIETTASPSWVSWKEVEVY